MTSRVRSEEGFGLIEAVVSLVILGVMMASLLPALANNMQINTTSDLRTGAVAVAQEVLDELRANEEDWPESGFEDDVDTGRGIYTYELEHEQFCDGDCFDGARLVSIEVAHNGRLLYEVETVFTALDGAGF